MAGIFSRFAVRGSYRRTQSAFDDREALPRSVTTLATATSTAASNHGIEMAVEFKALEHPNEPLDNDQPILCPLPEPSVLNDGRIWKERLSSGVQRRVDLPVLQEEQNPIQPETPTTTEPGSRPNLLPSISAPEHSILNLLEEYNASSG